MRSCVLLFASFSLLLMLTISCRPVVSSGSNASTGTLPGAERDPTPPASDGSTGDDSPIAPPSSDGTTGGGGGGGGGESEESGTALMSGAVATFPSEAEALSIRRPGKIKLRNYRDWVVAQEVGIRADEDVIEQDELDPAPAVISMYTIDDTDFSDPICTIKTDAEGAYEITTTDVDDYLVEEGLIEDGATDEEIIAAFEDLGHLHIRALVLDENSDEESSSFGMQTIIDPASEEDANVNPILHQFAKTTIQALEDQFDAIDDLDFLSDDARENMKDELIEDASDTLDLLIDEAIDETLEIPQGQDEQDIFDSRLQDLELELDNSQLTALNDVLSNDSSITAEQVGELQTDEILAADEIIPDAEKNLTAGMSSSGAGLLTRFQNTVADSIAGKVENLSDLDDASQSQADEKKADVLRESLQKFFLAMGFTVVLAQDEVSDTVVLASSLPSPPHIALGSLPGNRAFGDRQFRYFKVGNGDLTVDNVGPYADAITMDEDAAVKLEDITQEVVDALVSSPALTPSDFALLDRLRLFHEFARRLHEQPMVSAEVIEKIIANRDSAVSVKQLASVIASNFEWQREMVTLTEQGFPIFSGQTVTPATGASIDASELVKTLMITLGDSPRTTAERLVSNEQFYSQLARPALEPLLNHALATKSPEDSIEEVIAGVYPQTAIAMRNLIFDSHEFRIAQDRFARGLAAAVPQTLFGSTLSSESELNIRAAFFLTSYLLESQFLISSKKGFFTTFNVGDQIRVIPNFDNIKILKPASDDVSVATVVTELLNITEFDNSDGFAAAQEIIADLLSDLPILPEFRKQDLAAITTEFGGALSDVVDVKCTVKRYDGLDPRDPKGDDSTSDQLKVKLFAVQKDGLTGQPYKVTPAVSTQTDGEGVSEVDGVKITYTFADVPATSGEQRGIEYWIQFEIASYENDLPEFPIFVDGFSPQLVLCNSEFPMVIGPDHQFVPIPGMGLVSDQMRPQPGGAPLVEAIDLSNFEEPGKPIILTSFEESAGLGKMDFRFVSVEGGGYALQIADDDASMGFAPLWGTFSSSGLAATVDPGDGDAEVYGIQTVLGTDIRTAIEEVVDNAGLLSDTISIDVDAFSFNRVYLFKDRDGQYWLIELRQVNEFTDPSGAAKALIDFGFAKVDRLGKVDLPNNAMGEGHFGAFKEIHGDGAGTGAIFEHMFYGDWLVVENPTDYNGPRVIPPEEVNFWGDNEVYDALESASDGVIIRYASEHFEETIDSADDFETAFGNPPNFSSIPVRIDAGRDGITFITMTYDKQARQYVMSPAPDEGQTIDQAALSYASNLKHGTIIAIFNDQSDDPTSPSHIARVIKKLPSSDPKANFEIELNIVPFSPGSERSEVNILCFASDGECPNANPGLYFDGDQSTSIGTVYDSDFDGVPWVFDPNDSDPNVTGEGSHGPGAGGFGGGGGAFGGGSGGDFGGSGVGVSITPVVEADTEGAEGDAKVLFKIETQGFYPGDIDTLSIANSTIFGGADLRALFSCTPASSGQGGVFTETDCTANDTLADVTVVKERVNHERAVFTIEVDSSILEAMGSRTAFEMKATFRQPLDPQGNPFMCGSIACPARPGFSAKQLVTLPDLDDVNLFEDVTVKEGTESAADFATTTSLDVSKDLTIAAPPIEGAVDYELGVFCQGSTPQDAHFFPPEFLSFFSPARDFSGEAKAANWVVNLSHLGSRTCDFALSAHLENEAGERAGISRIVFSNVVMTGGFSGGNFNNELKLTVGAKVCFDPTTQTASVASGENCTEGMLELYTLEEILGADKNRSLVVSMADEIDEAEYNGEFAMIAEGRLNDGGSVVTNWNPIDLDNVNVICGSLSTDPQSRRGFCSSDTTFFALLERDGNVLRLTDEAQGLIIEGGMGEVEEISLDQPGMYRILADDLNDLVLSEEAITDGKTLAGDMSIDFNGSSMQLEVDIAIVGEDLNTEALSTIAIHAFEVDGDGNRVPGPRLMLLTNDENDWETGTSVGGDPESALKRFFDVTPEQMSAIQAAANGVYVSIHSSGFPAGDEGSGAPLLIGEIEMDGGSSDPIIEVNIDVFVKDDLSKDVFVRLGKPGRHVSYPEDTDGDPILTIPGRGFFRVETSSGPRVEFEVRFIDEGVAKLAWFVLPPQFDLLGEHDLDDDETDDISVRKTDGIWTFSFGDTVSEARTFNMLSGMMEAIAANDNGDITLDINGGERPFMQFEITLRSGKSYFFSGQRLDTDEATAEWQEFFKFGGGPVGQDPCSPGKKC